MVKGTCVMWLNEYRVDGLRFDSANDLPGHAVQVGDSTGPGVSRAGLSTCSQHKLSTVTPMCMVSAATVQAVTWQLHQTHCLSAHPCQPSHDLQNPAPFPLPAYPRR